jgi:hypothetical protein
MLTLITIAFCHLIAAVSFVAILVILAETFSGNSWAGERELPHRTVVGQLQFLGGSHWPTPVEIADSSRDPKVNKGTMFVLLRNFDPVRRQLGITVFLNLSKEVLESLTDLSEQHLITTTNGDGELTVKTQYENSTIEIRFRNRFSGPGTLVLLPLKSIFGTPADLLKKLEGPETHGAEAELALTGDPELYPSDWYIFCSFIYIHFPRGIAECDRGRIAYFLSSFDIAVGVASTWSRQEIALAVDPTHEQKGNGYIRSLDFAVVTPIGKQLYIYAIATVPSILVILISLLIFNPQVAAGLSVFDLLIGATAIILSILPIRSILVPEHYPVNTRVDKLFACSILLALSILLFRCGNLLMNPPSG